MTTNRLGNQDVIPGIQKLGEQELLIWAMSNREQSLKITIIDGPNPTKSKYLTIKVIEKLPTWVDVKKSSNFQLELATFFFHSRKLNAIADFKPVDIKMVGDLDQDRLTMMNMRITKGQGLCTCRRLMMTFEVNEVQVGKVDTVTTDWFSTIWQYVNKI